MREHPIPQDITNYRFHIIGSMTLKQFGEVALGFIVALILYKTNLLAIIKWPLIGVSIGVGIAAAFLPIEERPLDHWISTFIKILYKPTQFYWKRSPQVPKAFAYVATNLQPMEEEYDLSPARRQRIKEYLTSVSRPETDKFSLSVDEQSRVTSILTSFANQPIYTSVAQQSTAVIEPSQIEKPELSVRVRKMRPIVSPETVVYTSAPPQPAITHSPDQILNQTQLNIETQALVSPPTLPLSPVDSITTTQPPEIVWVAQPIPPAPTETIGAHQISQTVPIAQEQVAKAVEFNSDLPFPSTPTEINKVVGMVLTPHSDLLSDAIVEIQTPDGVVVRAVKTNALGQFFIATPLSNGNYTVIVEKDGFAFTPFSLQISGEIIQPIEIRSV